jgi:hypothetical protein
MNGITLTIFFIGFILQIIYLKKIDARLSDLQKYYVTVILCVKPDKTTIDVKNNWLLEKLCTFRIIPRIGDTLALDIWESKLPSVTEVILHSDGRCEIWCDLLVKETEIDGKINEVYGWIIRGDSDPKFHNLVNQPKLKRRKYSP